MSNDISRVYMFLAQQGADGAWVKKADANGDGAITKTEFKNFMNENFDWDRETTDAGKNDLINSFWKEVDTNTSGKISGLNIKNKNALDKKEIENMEAKLKLYEELNNYTSKYIKAPGFISNKNGWLKSVTESLSNLIKNEYKGKPEDLEAWLNSKNRAELSQAKATADYCANEYIADVMADVVKNYGYTYGDDDTLKGMINDYIQSHLKEFNPEEIQETVKGIIDSYMATANVGKSKEVGNADLRDYGYDPNGNSPLNELQKSIIKSKLEKEISKESKYEKYKDLYNNAMTTFLDGLKYNDFDKVDKDVLSEFKKSDAYKNMDKAIQAKEIFTDSRFKTTLINQLGSSVSDKINGIMTGEIPAYDKIIEDAVSKAQNGDFDDANGTLDQDKLINWIVGEIKANLVDFYPNGLGDMSIDELNKMYDALVASAKEKQDAQAVKNAAISYCKTISSKSTQLAKAVTEVFEDDNYVAKINSLTTGEIETKITELKAKVAQIGDVTKMTDAEKAAFFSGIKDSYTLDLGTELTFDLPRSAKCNGNVVTSDRISYSGSGDGLTVDPSTGKVTLNTDAPDTLKGTIIILIDGVKVTTKEITVIVNNKLSTAAIIKNTTWNENALSAISGKNGSYSDGDGGLRIWGGNRDYNDKSLNSAGISFADLYNGGYNIELMTTHDAAGKANNKNVQRARGRLLELGNLVVTTIASSNPTMDRAKLQSAMNFVNNSWITALDNKSDDAFTYKDNSDDKHGCNKASQREASNSTYNRLSDLTKTDTKAITFGQAQKGNNQGVYMVNFKAYVDAIIERYNELVK